MKYLIQKHARLLTQIDARSLAAFRVALAGIVLLDLWWRLPNVAAHLSDAGVLSRAELLRTMPTSAGPSLYLLGGSTTFAVILMLITAAAAVAVALGYRTRLATCALWVLVFSLHGRNPLILQAGDMLLRAMLFWLMFLPAGRAISIDSIHQAAPKPRLTFPFHGLADILRNAAHVKPPGPRVPAGGIAAFGLLFQVCSVYWVGAVLKWHPRWLEGEAFWWVLQLDTYVKPFGAWLRTHPELLPPATWLFFGAEIAAACIVWSPLSTRYLRLTAAIFMISLHAAAGFAIELGAFTWIAMAAWIPFLPALFWHGMQGLKPIKWLRHRASIELRTVASLLPPAPTYRLKPALLPVRSAFLWAVLALTGLWNLNHVLGDHPPPKALHAAIHALRMQQKWNMFAPYPITIDGWYVIHGELIDGRQVDVRSMDPWSTPDWSRPENMLRHHPDHYWRKYLSNLRNRNDRDRWLQYSRYLARTWNARHSGDDRIYRFEITFMQERTNPAGKQAQPITYWRHRAFKDRPAVQSQLAQGPTP